MYEPEPFEIFEQYLDDYTNYDGDIFVLIYPTYLEFNKNCSWASHHTYVGVTAKRLAAAIIKCGVKGYQVNYK